MLTAYYSGGEGWSANTSCKRVLVTHRDGRQTVEEIQNDLGTDCNDRQEVLDNLAKQGITDVTAIDLYGSADNTSKTSTTSATATMPVSPTTASKRQAPGGKSNLVLG
jgi:calcyphosin